MRGHYNNKQGNVSVNFYALMILLSKSREIYFPFFVKLGTPPQLLLIFKEFNLLKSSTWLLIIVPVMSPAFSQAVQCDPCMWFVRNTWLACLFFIVSTFWLLLSYHLNSLVPQIIVYTLYARFLLRPAPSCLLQQHLTSFSHPPQEHYGPPL